MLPNDLATPERVSALAGLLGSAFLKATAVLMLGTLCALFARAASAATRHMIWTLTLGGALVVPAVAALVPKWHVPISRWTMSWQPPVISGVPRGVAGPSSNVVLALSVPTADAPRDFATTAPVTRERPQAVPAPRATTATEALVAIPPTPAVPATAPIAPMATAMVIPAPAATPVPATDVVSAPTWSLVLGWVVGMWLLGVVIALSPTIIGLVRLALLRRRARPMRGGRWALLVPSAMRELDVCRRVQFLELDGAPMPMTWGVLNPIVLLPAGDFDSTIEQRLDVLRHELAHVRRYDCLTQFIGQVACAVHWYNPLAWVAARQLRVERERACDDEVLRAGAKASDYADYLLRVARTMHTPGAAAFGGLAMARPSQLAGRLLAVLDDRRQRGRLSTRAAVRATLLSTMGIVMVASVSPVPAAARDVSIAAAAPRMPGVVATTVRPERAVAPIASVAAVAPTAPVALDGPTPITLVLPSVAAPPFAVIAGSSSRAAAATLATTVATVTLPYVVPPPAPCDRDARGGKRSSHTNWTTSDNGSKRWRVLWSQGDCSYEIEARGEIKYNRDVTDVESISSGGSFVIEQHLGDDTRRLVIRPRPDGTLERTYSVDGSRREYDDAARAWFADALVALDRETAFAVDQRVPAILERAGVNGVLQEISLLGSDYARRRYYTKLLSARQLDGAQVRRVVTQAGTEMSSDYELAELLVALSKVDAFGDDSHTAFVTAAKKINSDYERRRALNALLRRDQLGPATVQALLEAASTIGSDYELAELLIDVSKRYAVNDQTRPVYLEAVGSIQSDYEHRRVLAAIVAGGSLTPAVSRALLEDAQRIKSDYELTEFLIQIAKKGGLDSTTRDAYFAAADKIRSDYEHRRALTPLLSRDLLTKELAKGILASAAKIDSDYECASLLVELAKAITIDDDLRPAFDRAADTIQGEYEYGRAMSAVRRRVTR